MIVAVAYLAISGLLGGALLLTVGKARGGPSGSAAGESTPSATTPASTAPGPTTDTPTSSPETPAPSPTETSGVPSDYQQVAGPQGMTTVVPIGWPVAPVRTDVLIANDPADTGRFVEFGGSAVPAGDMLSAHVQYEYDFIPSHPRYSRLRLESTTYHGFPAVDWEFTWVKVGVPRHVRILYWQTGDLEYFVYVSCTAPRWDETETIYESMVANSTP